MKRRKLFAPYLTHSWIVFAAGAAVWVLTVLLFRIKSVNTGDPYIFKGYGSADIVTPVIMMFMGIFSSIPYYSACSYCNVSRYRAAEPVVFTAAAFSLIYTILDIIAIKKFIPPVEGYDTVNCFFEGRQLYRQSYTFDELLEYGKIIIPVMYSFIFLFSMWLCGAMIGRAFVNGEKAAAIYETVAFFVFFLLFILIESKNIRGTAGSVINSLEMPITLVMIITFCTDLPVIICMILYITVYPPVDEVKDVMSHSMMAGQLNFVLLIIVWFILVRRVEVYLTKNHKNEDTGGDDDA